MPSCAESGGNASESSTPSTPVLQSHGLTVSIPLMQCGCPCKLWVVSSLPHPRGSLAGTRASTHASGRRAESRVIIAVRKRRSACHSLRPSDPPSTLTHTSNQPTPSSSQLPHDAFPRRLLDPLEPLAVRRPGRVHVSHLRVVRPLDRPSGLTCLSISGSNPIALRSSLTRSSSAWFSPTRATSLTTRTREERWRSMRRPTLR